MNILLKNLLYYLKGSLAEKLRTEFREDRCQNIVVSPVFWRHRVFFVISEA